MSEKYSSSSESIREISISSKSYDVNGLANSEKETAENAEDEIDRRATSGLSVNLASYFMIAQLAGAGFLSLPNAFAESGWLGTVMMVLFCIGVGFSTVRLADSWMLLEERYPEYRKPVRQPYMEMAYRSMGTFGRRITLVLVMVTNMGAGVVFIILMAGLLNSLVCALSICEWSLVVVGILIPFCWLGTPKDYWQASVFAVVSTILAILIILVKLFLDHANHPIYPPPNYPHPTVGSFSLAFGAILFAYGGSSVFPTIQNDMKERNKFWKSVIISFAIIFSLYFPVAFFGYLFLGDSVDSNVILSISSGPAVTVAIVFEIFNLLGTFIITMSPVFLSFEDMLKISPNFNLKRVGVRTVIIIFQLFIGLAFPDFGLVLDLIGGSAMSVLACILPPIMYIRLCKDKSNKEFRNIDIPLWEKLLLWELMFIGIVGGITSTVTSLISLLSPRSFAASCLADFGRSESCSYS